MSAKKGVRLQVGALFVRVLAVSIGLKGFSMAGCLREINKIRGERTLWQWINQSRSSELIVVFGEDLAALQEAINGDDDIREVYNVITLQMGGKVMLAAKLRLRESMPVETACEKINALETRIRGRFPEIGGCFMEPDVRD